MIGTLDERWMENVYQQKEKRQMTKSMLQTLLEKTEARLTLFERYRAALHAEFGSVSSYEERRRAREQATDQKSDIERIRDQLTEATAPVEIDLAKALARIRNAYARGDLLAQNAAAVAHHTLRAKCGKARLAVYSPLGAALTDDIIDAIYRDNSDVLSIWGHYITANSETRFQLTAIGAAHENWFLAERDDKHPEIIEAAQKQFLLELQAAQIVVDGDLGER